MLRYTHVKEQKVNFKRTNKILESLIIEDIFPNRILTSVDVLKFKNIYLYRFEFFKSNGSLEIDRIYNLNGDIIKYNDSTDISKDSHFEVVKNFDLTSLYIREKG